MVNGSPSEIEIEYGPPAAGVITFTFHLPFSSAVLVYVFLFQDVVVLIDAPGFAQPQIDALTCCCNTMPSLKKEGSCTVAERKKGNNKTGIKESIPVMRFFLSAIIINKLR